ncbi:MAG: hypothetical protein ACOC12_04690 [Bacteroidota bacterium]
MRKIYSAFLFIIVFFIASAGLLGQSTFLPAGHQWHDFVQRMEIKSGGGGAPFHLALRPLARKDMMEFLLAADTSARRITPTDRKKIQAIAQSNAEWNTLENETSRRPVLRHFYKHPSDFYRYHNEDLFLVINPVLHLQTGFEEQTSSPLYLNTRGLEIRGMINGKVGFYTFMADNQARFPFYVREKIRQQEGAIPGEGWNIPFGVQGHDFFTARGHIAFQATKNIGFQFGQDRNFIGYGQRSLLLSDYGNNYLFFKINTRVWRFHYQNVFARLVDWPLRSYGGRRFDPKYMAAHTLSFKISDRFQLGVFENVVFGRADTLVPRQFDPHYLNPVIFYRAVEHHIGDPDKISLGIFWRWIMGYRIALYGQFYADDFHVGDLKYDLDKFLHYMGFRSERKYDLHASFRHKYALQQGLHWVDFLGIDNLDVQLEGNWIRPFVYSHYATDGSGLRPSSNYSHYSQPLAHPMGANLREYMAVVSYHPHPNWHIRSVLFNAQQGVDSAGVNMGGDIFRDYTTRVGDYGHTFLQGEQRKVSFAQFSVSWQWKPNLWLETKYVVRQEELQGGRERSGIFMAGIRLNALRRGHWF